MEDAEGSVDGHHTVVDYQHDELHSATEVREDGTARCGRCTQRQGGAGLDIGICLGWVEPLSQLAVGCGFIVARNTPPGAAERSHVTAFV